MIHLTFWRFDSPCVHGSFQCLSSAISSDTHKQPILVSVQALETGYAAARDSIRASHGIKVMLNMLQARGATNTIAIQSIRAATCRVLLGLARDPVIRHILSKLQLSRTLTDLIRLVIRCRFSPCGVLWGCRALRSLVLGGGHCSLTSCAAWRTANGPPRLLSESRPQRPCSPAASPAPARRI